MGGGESRLDADRFLVGADRPLVVALVVKREPAVVIEHGIVGLGGYRLVEIAHRAVELALAEIGDAAVVEGAGAHRRIGAAAGLVDDAGAGLNPRIGVAAVAIAPVRAAARLRGR